MAKLNWAGGTKQIPDDSGDPLNGGLVYFYEPGTSTPKDTYTTSDLGTANANPVVLDADGRANIWLNGNYKVVVKDSDEVEIYTEDNINPDPDASGGYASKNGDVITKSANYAMVAGDDGKLIIATSGTWTLSTGSAASAYGDGWHIDLYNHGAGVITFDPNSTETVNGVTTLAVGPGDHIHLRCDGVNWYATRRSVVVSTDAGSTAGPDMELYRLSASPADADFIGRYLFTGDDDGGNRTIYGSIDCQIDDVTDTTEDSTLLIKTMVAGTLTTQIDISSAGAVFTAGITAGGNIVSDTDSTDDLGTTSVRWANVYTDSIGDSGQVLTVKNDINFSVANPEILGGDTDGITYLYSGASTSLGAGILMYGDTHATAAKDMAFRSNTTNWLLYDDSAAEITITPVTDFTNGIKLAAGTDALNVYDEFTWTPIISDGTNNATNAAESAGWGTTIGDIIHYGCRINLSSLGSVSGGTRITGLPTANISTPGMEGFFHCGFGTNLAIAANTSISGLVPINAAYVTLQLWDDVTGSTALQGSEVSADGVLIGGGNYKTA